MWSCLFRSPLCFLIDLFLLLMQLAASGGHIIMNFMISLRNALKFPTTTPTPRHRCLSTGVPERFHRGLKVLLILQRAHGWNPQGEVYSLTLETSCSWRSSITSPAATAARSFSLLPRSAPPSCEEWPTGQKRSLLLRCQKKKQKNSARWRHIANTWGTEPGEREPTDHQGAQPFTPATNG